MEKEMYLTPEGLKKLEDELDHLKTVHRKEIAERIRQAKDFGEIAENPEYEAAKNEQAFLEGRILTLEKLLRNAKLIDESEHHTKVTVGSHVRLRDMETKEEFDYTIVGSAEADPARNKISNESPVGKAIMDAGKGKVVEVSTPQGGLKYKIISVK
ncbi:MAG: transcription elongation factor GreA [bacterium]|nr:transcription elongation factor GreA [bacterium]